jgi:murein DD-endopeptidase MepM/ murein hydrolase activator NlpD
MTKRLSLLALVVLLAIASTLPAQADELEENLASVRARIASLEEQIRSTSGERSEIAEEVLAVSGRLEIAEAEVAQAQIDLKVVRDELTARQLVLTDVRTELAARLVALAQTRSERDGARREAESSVVQAYMRGGVDLPRIAFSATGIAEVSVGIGYLDTLTASSSGAADRYAGILAQEELERARVKQLEGTIDVEVRALEESEYQAEVLTAELAIKRAALDNEYKAQTALLARVDAEIAAYENEKEDFEKEAASIRAIIAAAAAKAKAAAEARARENGSTRDPATSTGNGSLSWPIRGPIDSPFGWRIHPITWDRRYHTGLDIDGPAGMPIKAAKSGTVILAGVKGGYGNAVMIDHGNGWVTLYAHQQSLNVSVGQWVTPRTTIGWVGSSGNSTGPHLHFELIINGSPVDPMRYL